MICLILTPAGTTLALLAVQTLNSYQNQAITDQNGKECGISGCRAIIKVDLCEEVIAHFNNKFHIGDIEHGTRGVKKHILASFVVNGDDLDG